MWFFRGFLVLVASRISSSGDIEKNRSMEELDEEVDSLYKSMSAKSSPLYICDPNIGGIEWLPPTELDCEFQPKENDSAKVISLTVYWTDISLQVVDGFECSGTKIYAEGYRKLWESAFTITEDTLVLRISYQQCQEFVQKRVSPFGRELKRVNDDLFETGFIVNRTEKTYFFARGFEEVRLNYRIQRVKITISSIDNTIQTTALIVDPCAGNSSYCATSNGMLVWNGLNVKTCRLKEGQDSNCLLRYSNNMTVLSCPDVKLSLHNVETVTMCGVKFGHSHGIYFLLGSKDDVFPEMATPESVKTIITRPRHKREIHPFEAEHNANLNFLYDTIRKGTVEAVWMAEQKVCEANKASLDLINALTQSGHPGLITRLLYKNDLSYRADFSGDVPTIYRCIEIHQYMFTERKSCIFEFPVKYIYNNKEFDGFMTPSTHTIVSVPTNRTRSIESCPRFYFKTEDYVVVLANKKATKVNLPTLPQKSAAHDTEEFLPPLSFVPTGNIDANSADVGAFYQMFKEVQHKSYVPNITEKHVTYVENSGSFGFGGIVDFFGDLWNGVIVAARAFILPVIYVCIGILLFLVLMFTGILPFLFKLPVRLYYFFKRATPLKKIRKALGYRKLSRRVSPRSSDTHAPSAPLLYLGNGSQPIYGNGTPNYQNERSNNLPISQFQNYAHGMQNWQAYQNNSTWQQRY